MVLGLYRLKSPVQKFGLAFAFITVCQVSLADQRTDLKNYLIQLNSSLLKHHPERAIQTLVFHVKDGSVTVNTESREITQSGTAISVFQTPTVSVAPLRFENLPLSITDPLHQFPNQFDQALEASGLVDSSVSVEGAGQTLVKNLHKESVAGIVYDVLEFSQDLPKPQETRDDSGSLICTRLEGKLFLDSAKRIRRKTGTIFFTGIDQEKGNPKVQSASYESSSIEYIKLP